MSAIQVPESQPLVGSKYTSKESFEQLASAKKWIPYIQFYTSNSGPCKAGKFPINMYGMPISNDKIKEIGKEFTALVYGWRPKAVDISGDKPISFYNPQTDSFKRVKAEADKPGLNGFMCGPEFLLYIAGTGFVTFLMSSTTARNEAEAVAALQGKAALFSGKEISNKKFTWWGPFAIESTVTIDLPDQAEYDRISQQFANPPESEVELAPEEANAQAGEQRER